MILVYKFNTHCYILHYVMSFASMKPMLVSHTHSYSMRDKTILLNSVINAMKPWFIGLPVYCITHGVVVG